MRVGLVPRVTVFGTVAVATLTIEFVLVLHAFHAVRAANAREQRAEQAVIAATTVENLVLDLETGTRGFVLTVDDRFLQPWQQARARLPAATTRLQALAPGAVSAKIGADWRAYLHDYSEPLIAKVRVDRKAASSRLATGEGKRRVDAIRGLIDPLVRRQSALTAAERGAVGDQEHDGILYGLGGVGLMLLLFVVALVRVFQVAVFPLRRLASAMGEVAEGRNVEVAGGVGEIKLLAAAFNEMSASLAESQRNLEAQNDDLERLANLLRAVLDATLDGILLSDATGGVQLVNLPMIELARELGMTVGDNVVDNLLSIESDMVDPGLYRARMEQLREESDDATFDEFEVASTGRVFQGFTSPVRDTHGSFVGRIWTLREVTQQRELERLKDDFVATVSHELRTPLTSMMGFLEMLRDGDAGELTEDQERFLTIVYRNSERLQRLVGDLLFVARLDASGLELELGQVRIDEVVREVAESTVALVRSRDLDLVVEPGGVGPIEGDRERVAQVIANLLSNAVKFTPPGGRVVARTTTEGELAVIEVEDTGIGIPADEQSHLFERFFRSSTATEQAIPGTGLGLVIAKAIVEAHGGRIRVRSEAGVGTSFRVELPFEQPDET
jgi:signal transduction histidine kinase/CHASE3 domain sensor protein